MLCGSSYALNCYTCDGFASLGVKGVKNPEYAGKPCFDSSLEMKTCDAKHYCVKLQSMCGRGTIRSFILSSMLVVLMAVNCPVYVGNIGRFTL